MPVDVNHVLEEAIRIADLHSNRDVLVQALLEPGLPSVHGSASRLEQVFLNLLVNAKHALADRPAGRIEVATRLIGQRRRGQRSRRRPGRTRSAAPSDLRSVLHDQGSRTRHRPRPVDCVRHRARTRWRAGVAPDRRRRRLLRHAPSAPRGPRPGAWRGPLLSASRVCDARAADGRSRRIRRPAHVATPRADRRVGARAQRRESAHTGAWKSRRLRHRGPRARRTARRTGAGRLGTRERERAAARRARSSRRAGRRPRDHRRRVPARALRCDGTGGPLGLGVRSDRQRRCGAHPAPASRGAP